MSRELPQPWLLSCTGSTLVTLVFNTLIALLLTLLMEMSFWDLLIISQSIGLTISTFANLLKWWQDDSHFSIPLLLLAVVMGSLLGGLLGAALTGNLALLLEQGWQGLPLLLLLGLVFGVVVSYFFYSRFRLAESETALQAAKLQQITIEKQLVEAHLKRLQAQIEPHFLFNTLSTIQSLIETEPETAGRILEELSRYLRASLGRTRQEQSTLAEELDTLQAYLAIQQQRMGTRLIYRFEVDPQLHDYPIPPLLLQPLVENALIHGLEPSLRGGSLLVSAQVEAEQVVLKVVDRGVGIGELDGDGRSVGLINIAQRLEALYHDQARLQLLDNEPSGVIAQITLPWELL